MAAIKATFEKAIDSAVKRCSKKNPGNQAATNIADSFKVFAEACLKRNLEVGERKLQFELVQVWPMVERELYHIKKMLLKG